MTASDDTLLLDASAQAALGHMGLRWVELAQRGAAAPKTAAAVAIPPTASPAAAQASALPAPAPAPAATAPIPAPIPSAAPRVLAQPSQSAPLTPATPPAMPPGELPALQPLGERPARPVSESAWQDCQDCPRGTQRQQALAGWGPWQAGAAQPAPRLWLVLDAPARSDDLRPDALLADARGALLDQFLSALGWRRQDVALTWAVQCHGPVAPDSTAITACQPWLAGRLAAHRPAAVLALGRQAALALVGGQAPLRDLRQRQHAVPLPGQEKPLPVIASFALDFLLGNPLFKGPAWYDWCRAAALAQESDRPAAQGHGA